MEKTILLIEDNKDVRENTAEILQLAGYILLTAKNGREGVELAQKEHVDLIICDIMMPVLDGYGVLHMVSKNEQTAGIPFIFLTARADRHDQRKGMEMGADDYLTKPFDDTELLSAVESRLRKSEIMKRDFHRNLQGLNAFLDSAKSFDDLRKLSEHNEFRLYKKKESIYSEDTYARGIFFLSAGKVKTFMANEQGKEFITGLYKEGDFFGYLPLFDEKPYSDSATALEDSQVCFIPKDDFFALIYKNAEVSRQFIRLISDNLKEKEDQLVKLAYNSVRKRVAEALVMLYNRYKKEGEEHFGMNISREDLANLSGTATETTIRTLSDFKDEGLVDIKGSFVAISDYGRLSKMKN